jgi:hypothetical protein
MLTSGRTAPVTLIGFIYLAADKLFFDRPVRLILPLSSNDLTDGGAK